MADAPHHSHKFHLKLLHPPFQMAAVPSFQRMAHSGPVPLSSSINTGENALTPSQVSPSSSVRARTGGSLLGRGAWPRWQEAPTTHLLSFLSPRTCESWEAWEPCLSLRKEHSATVGGLREEAAPRPLKEQGNVETKQRREGDSTRGSGGGPRRRLTLRSLAREPLLPPLVRLPIPLDQPRCHLLATSPDIPRA